jgi:hypothetical protein
MTILDGPKGPGVLAALFMILYYQLNHALWGVRGKELSNED